MSINYTYTAVRAMSNATCEIGSQLMVWDYQSGGETFNIIFNSGVYQNKYWVERWHIPNESTPASPQNAWQFLRAATATELSTIGNFDPTDVDLQPGGDPNDVLHYDEATEATYTHVGFAPEGDGSSNLSYSASRVCNSLYNRYDQDTTRPKVSAYITDWCQYDARLEEDDVSAIDPTEYGRGFDLAKIPATAYDKLIFSFMAVAGDVLFPGEKVQQAMDGWNSQVGEDEQISVGHIVPVDPYGDLGSSVNVGGGEPHPDCDYPTFLSYYSQDRASGLLGGLRDLKEQARREGHSLELAFSIGGWSLSSYFSHMAKTPAIREEFIASVVDFFKRFPMFTGVDIDWEYPGGGGLYDNTATDEYDVYTAQDGANYVTLAEELRAELDANFQGSNRKEISIACSAVKAKMEKSNLKELSDAGVDNIYLMSYDFFGTPWASHIGHHTNLYAPAGETADTVAEADLGADLAIQYLIQNEGIPPSKINLGYANYGRSCVGANLTDRSYTQTPAGSDDSLGSYENGAPEFFDIVNNYMDIENNLAVGKNGFTLMTDTTVDADFLYSTISGINHYISLDTPRTVKQKSEYAITHQLGGVFSWSGDQDCGVLANAAREGAGYLASAEIIDMGPLYNPGEPQALAPVDEL